MQKDYIDNLQKFASSNKDEMLANLGLLIDSIDNAKKDYESLQELFYGVIEVLPTALWVFNKDGSIFLQNTKAKELNIQADTLKQIQSDCEMEFNSRFYIFQSSIINDKKIISATDNTKSKREERLISMGQMAAHLAHEIRNPIGSVSILASTLFNKVDIKAKPLVLEIKKSIWRVERIVKATLLFSKGFTINYQKFFISNFQEELETALLNYSYSKEIEFIFNLTKEPIEADLDLLSMVFQNMLFNAIDAIEESDIEAGIIKFEYIKDKKNHIFKIVDNGSEFEDKDKLFEAFASTKTKGHGLGLTLSLKIIQAHNGKIELLTDEKGFLISIPKFKLN